MKTVAQPHFIVLNQRKNFFVSNGIHIANNHKLLFSSIIHAKNSRNSEKGGLVMMMSASSRNFFISALLKSPSPFR
jgi:hypothetical protein